MNSILILSLALGADISGGVVQVNNPPATQPRPLVMTYRAIYERVTGGQVVLLAVGSDEPGYERVDDVPKGVKPGLYRCTRAVDANGKPILDSDGDPIAVFDKVEPVRALLKNVAAPVVNTGRWVKQCLGNGTCRMVFVQE